MHKKYLLSVILLGFVYIGCVPTSYIYHVENSEFNIISKPFLKYEYMQKDISVIVSCFILGGYINHVHLDIYNTGPNTVYYTVGQYSAKDSLGKNEFNRVYVNEREKNSNYTCKIRPQKSAKVEFQSMNRYSKGSQNAWLDIYFGKLKLDGNSIEIDTVRFRELIPYNESK